MEFTQLSLFGKTYPERSPQTEVKTSSVSLKSSRTSGTNPYQFLDLRAGNGLTRERSWQTDGLSRGGAWTRAVGAFPSVACESFLSQILEAWAPVRYYLTAKACLGILSRATRRGKKLPPELEDALTRQAGGAIGFYPQMKAESMCITEEKQPCLVNGTNPGFQNGVCIPLEGNGSRPPHQGDGYGQAGGPAYTLNTVEQHAVCYRKSARAQSSDDGETWVRDERANTLNTFDLGDTRTSQAIVTANAIGNGQADQTGLHDKVGALNCMHDQQAVLVYNNHPNDSRVTETRDGVLDTLSSWMGMGGNNTPLVAAVDCRNGTSKPTYIVRRLMPVECARLQGFPDWWCADLDTKDPTDEEIAFWEDVFETHRRIVTKSSKPKSRRQIVKWLQHPHSDAAEYKMWGNGVALPCVYNVMKNIADELQEEDEIP